MTLGSLSGLFRRRVPYVPQMERTECGPACVGMVLAHFGCHVPLAELREAAGVSRDGTSALDIALAANRYGLETEAYQVDLGALSDVALPAIVHWEFNHFVVLERLGPSSADIVDPASGPRTVTYEEMDRGLTGVVLELRRGPAFVKRGRGRGSLATYRRLVGSAMGPALVMMSSGLLLEIFALLFPAATALVVDFVVRPRQEHWIPILGLAFAVAVVLRAAITLSRDRILSGLETKLDVELLASLASHVFALPTAFFSQRSPGELQNRIGALLTARDAFARIMLGVFDAILVAAYVALMLAYDVRLGAIVTGLHVVMVLATNANHRSVRAATTTRVTAAGRAQSALVQAFADPESAKAFGAESLLLAHYSAARAQELNARATVEKALDGRLQALAVFQALGAAAVLTVGGRAVMADRMTLGVLASFFAIQTLISAPLERIVAVFRDLGAVGPLLERVDDMLEQKIEPSGTFVPDHIEGALTFEHVSFRYGRKGPLLLDDVSFHVDAGERVAIAGASGAGKSTILKLVLGFVRPIRGRILLDGRDLREYDTRALRAAMGTVLAGGALFDESILDNVALADPGATPSQVREAVAAACVDDVVDALPHGLSTRLGSGAARLSGGQRQRLLLARALLKRPMMLLLDEASSALDAELERRVQEYLTRMRCTMLVVAHRLTAVSFADRVLYLENGKIVQDGPFAELARREGRIRDLVRASGGMR